MMQNKGLLTLALMPGLFGTLPKVADWEKSKAGNFVIGHHSPNLTFYTGASVLDTTS